MPTTAGAANPAKVDAQRCGAGRDGGRPRPPPPPELGSVLDWSQYEGHSQVVHRPPQGQSWDHSLGLGEETLKHVTVPGIWLPVQTLAFNLS